MEEIWKDVVGYEGLYQVSNLGNVKSLDRITITKKGQRTFNGKLLKFTKDGFGYSSIFLCKDGKPKHDRVHVLVAMAFLGHNKCGLNTVVDHINNNPSDNRLVNLQLITHRENISKQKTKHNKLTGAVYHKTHKKYISKIQINGKLKHLGYFNTEIEAHNRYKTELNNIK